VAYRWLAVAAALHTVMLTWNVWQVRSGPNWKAWEGATPLNRLIWEHRPADAELAPMLPLWDWLPQFDIGWPIVASLLLILVMPRTGLAILSSLLVLGVLMDQTRLQPHYAMVFLILATLPGINAKTLGRANLIALWFWAGFHKLIIDFIKPDGMFGFRSDTIPTDLAHFFPVDKFGWNTYDFGVAMGWVIAITEVTLGLLCFIPRARWMVAVIAFGLHAGIIWWNCLGLHCNLLGWNSMLMLAGIVLILPWREWPWMSWKQCNWLVRVLVILSLVGPAGFYLNWTAAYLSYCVYVPNTPFAILYRPGEQPKSMTFMPYEVINFPMSPAHSILRKYFEKIRQPGDVMILNDPRPWAQSNEMNGRQITDYGEFPRGKHWIYESPDGQPNAEGSYIDDKKQGLWRSWHANGKIASQGVMIDDQRHGRWVQWYDDGNKQSQGSYSHGRQEGPWTFWTEDGKKEMEGDFVDGQMDGVWKTWSPDGAESEIRFKNGAAVPQ
jgi:hypothetical protein